MAEISVIVPVYNVETKLKRCLDSIRNQTFSDFEVIIIDDGSTDSSPIICDEYVKIDARFKVFHIENGGVSNARNLGIAKSSGKYLYFADADDFVLPNCLEDLRFILEKENCQLVIANAFYYYEDRQITEEHKSYLSCEQKYDKKHIEEIVLTRCFNGHIAGISNLWNKLYVKSVIQKFNILFNSKRTYGEDLDFNIEYLKIAQSLYVLDKPVYVYALDNTQNYAKYSKGLAYSLLDGHKKAEELNEQYVGYKKDSIEYAKFKGRFAEQTIAYLVLKECSKKEKKQYLKDKVTKDALKYLRTLDADKLEAAGFSRRDKFAFMLLGFGAYKLALKILRRK